MLLDFASKLSQIEFNFNAIQTFLIITIAFPLFLIGTEYVKKFSYHRKCAQHGVAPVPYNGDGYLGIKYAILKIQDSINHCLLEGLEQDTADFGTRTYMNPAITGDTFVTQDPENIKFILSTNQADFTIGLRSQMLDSFIGEGIFTQNGHSWKHSRNLLKPQFARSQITNVSLFEENADSLIGIMRENSRRGSAVDVMHYFQCLTLDFAVEFLTGERLGCLFGNSRPLYDDNKNPTPAELQEALNYSSEFVMRRAFATGFYWVVNSIKYQRSIRLTKRFFEIFVKRARGVANSPSSAKKNERYVFVNQLAKEEPNDIALRDQCMNVFLAGRDTTSSLLSLTFHYLSRYPDVWDRLRQEIIETYSDSKDGLTGDNLRSCKYLKAVVNEVLRISAVIPMNVRCPIKDVVLPRGGGLDGSEPTLVPKGKTIVIYTFGVQRDEEYWGADAKEFNPERWMKPGHPATDPWAYIPFSGGPRICIGQQLALNEVYYTVSRICQSFSHISPPHEKKDESLKYHAGIATFPLGGVPINVTE